MQSLIISVNTALPLSLNVSHIGNTGVTQQTSVGRVGDWCRCVSGAPMDCEGRVQGRFTVVDKVT